MARNTLSRAERYHPKGKKTNYNKTVSFLLQFPPALCASRESPLTDPLAKNLAGMRGRSGSKVCFVFLLSLVGNFQKRAQIQNLVSKYRAYAKRQWQSQNTNEQTKQTKKTYKNSDWFWQLALTTMNAWNKVIGTVNSDKQLHRCQQKLDGINHCSILGDPGLETIRHAVSLDLTLKDSKQSLVFSIKTLQFTD